MSKHTSELLEAAKAFVSWLDAKNDFPDYDHLIEWKEKTDLLFIRAQRLTRAAIAKAEGRNG